MLHKQAWLVGLRVFVCVFQRRFQQMYILV